MREQSSVFGGPATSLELRYTGKPVSGWGGLVAVMRYLERRGVRRVLGQFVFGELTRPALGATLDLDSTVFERYGRQEGSLKGHNPRKHGRPSHHPLLAILAEAKLVLHAWLRSGNTASARGVKAFLAETLARVPADFRFYAVRADSGFFLSEFLEELERRALPYAIAVRMNPLLRRAVAGIREWQPVAPGLEAAETSYSAHGWNAPRRLVVVRELLRERPQARGRKLLEVPGYTFHVLVTTLSHDPVQTWRFYNSRAEIENRIKELKEDFGAGGFCLQSFYGTEAAFRLICFLFNLVAQFKREVTQDEAPRLSTLRTKILVIGAIIGSEGRQTVLRLGLRDRWRQHFAVLLERIAGLAISTVAQFTDHLKNIGLRPWKPRRPARLQHLSFGA